MAAKIVTVAQQKGGAGKTTIAAHLAVAFTEAKHRVALIDIDPQQSLTMWFQQREALYDDAESALQLNPMRRWRTRRDVAGQTRDADLVLIDSPPHAEAAARMAVRTANLVIVPVQPSPMDVWATMPTLELASQERVPVLLVLNRVPPRANLTEDMVPEIRQFGAKLARTRIGNRIAFAGALADGLGVSEMEPSGRATQEITRLAREVLRAVK